MNLFQKLIQPRLPASAIGLSAESVSAVSLDRHRDMFAIKRAGVVPLPEGLLHPSFDDKNISDPDELRSILAELVSSVGMLKQSRWSIALPESSTRTAIATLESAPQSRAELEEMLNWKIERAMSAPLDELRVSREGLSPDLQGRARYLVTAVRLSVLDEYEAVFESLNWRAGLILPRHMGEAWWLMKDRAATDSLLVSAHDEGFTAVLLRDRQPFIVRNVLCSIEDRADEFYRFLLFYRDRITTQATEEGKTTPSDTIERLLIAGNGFDIQQATSIVNETLSTRPRTLSPEDVRLAIPTGEINFNTIAAPAGLAALAWA